MTTTARETTLFTVAETAQKLRCDPQTIRRHARKGRLIGVKVGNYRYLFTQKQIDDFLAAGTTTPVAPEPKPARNPRYTK